MAELPAVQQFADQLSSRGVVVVGIHYSSIKAAELRTFLKEHDVRMAIGLDAEGAKGGWFGRTFQAYGVVGSPCFVVLGKDGTVKLMTHSLAETMGFVDALRKRG